MSTMAESRGEDACRRSAAACGVVAAVLARLAPVEAELVGPYIEPLVRLAEGGEIFALDISREPGRFGDMDLLVLVIVPLVVGLLQGVEETDSTDPLSKAEVEAMARRVGSAAAQRRSAEIAAAIRDTLPLRPSRGRP